MFNNKKTREFNSERDREERKSKQPCPLLEKNTTKENRKNRKNRNSKQIKAEIT